MLSFFGRANYSYADRYFLQATLRTDGYSGLGREYKWSTFPSFSAGWRITEEKFMQSTKSWLNNLKLRLSWGVSGSGNNSIMATTRAQMSLVTLSPQYASIIVPDLTCEKTSTFDAGLDFTLLNGRLGGSIDYYTSRSHDLIFNDVAHYMTMSFNTYSNIAKTKGHGLEIALNAVPVITKDFRWDVNTSATFAKSEIVKLTDGMDKVVAGSSAAIIGQPVSIFYDYETGNCWGVGEYEKYCADYKARTGNDFIAPVMAYGTPGTMKIIDRNDDGKIDDNDKRVYDRSPKAILGMTNTFSYKNFSLSVQIMARLGGYMAYDKNNALGLGDGDANWADVSYWTPTNTDTKFPSPGANDNTLKAIYTTYRSALKYEKADYFKIKDITLSYNLEKNWLKSLHMSDASVYCSLKNFITINALDDNYDPERGGSISFPLAKQFVLGLNITF